MKGEALLFMLFSWGLIGALCTFCFSKLFSNHSSIKKKRKRA